LNLGSPSLSSAEYMRSASVSNDVASISELNKKSFAKEAQALSLTPGPRQKLYFLCALQEGARAPRLTSRPERASDMHPQAQTPKYLCLPDCRLLPVTIMD